MIREYYTDRSLLITGSTGFVGQALLAKILRELGDEVRRVFLMIRPRRRTDGREISPAERLQELYRTTLFEPIAEADPGRWERLREKVVPVAIDERQADLGLSSEDRLRLAAEVDTIFNSAATVVFDEPLDVSVQANVAGPLALMEIARASKRDVDFVHVSTAYVNGRRQGRIPDEPLPVDRDMRQIIDGSGGGFDPVSEVADCRAACRRLREEAAAEVLTRRLEDEVAREYGRTGNRKLTSTRLEQLVEDRRARSVQRRLVDEGMRRAREHGWNDVYTYTKALGEQMLTLRRGDVPLVVVRPSIIESSLADPEPGWITGLKVMDPLVVAYGRGLLPDFPARPDIVLDLVPVDRVVNATIAAAVRARPDSVEVFQVATGTENPVRLGSLFDSVRAHFLRSPMPDRDGDEPPLPDWRYPSVRLFRTVFRLRHLGPVQLREWLLDLPGRSPPPRQRRLLGTAKVRLQRVLYYVDLYHPYTHLDCRFETARTRALYESLPPEERATFDMDVTGIDWPAYVADIHLPGLRRHVLGEESAPEAGLPEAPGEPGVEEERLRAEREISTLPDLLRWACARHAGRTAIEARREGRWHRITYAELLQRVEERAGRWQGLGLTLGDRVLLAGENGPEWVISCMACSFLGAAVVPVDPQTPGEEVERIAAFCEARAIVAGPAVLEGVVPAAGRMRIDLLSGAPAGEATAAPSTFQEPEISHDREASIIFTSGTRVDPRGVILTHGNLISDLLALGEVQRVYDSDRILSLLPLHHGLEFTGALLTSLWGGASIFYLDGPLNSRNILDTIREQEITAVLAVPRILKILADRVRRLDTRTDGARPDDVEVLRRLRLIVSGGAPLGEELFDAYRDLGLTVYEGYGLTETSPIVTVNPPGGARRGSVGVALPCVELRIDAPQGHDGEILVSGSSVTPGYLNRPDLTAEVLRDGWLRTGDLGHLDEDGYLFITGRQRDLIVTGGGKNVYPDEVEDLYSGLPHTAELAVVGLPSARTLGEEVHGVAVLDHRARDMDPHEAEERIRERAYALSRDLPTWQRIARLHIQRRPLPRLDDGRVDRGALREDLERGGPDEVDAADSLAPWERQVYHRLSHLSGLAVGEIVAHADAPLDTLIDSLMAVELAACLEEAGARPLTIDRRRTTLRRLLDEAGPALTLAEAGEKGYWSSVLGGREPGERTGRSALGAAAARVLRSALGVEVEGEGLPGEPFLLAASRPGPAAAAAVYAALRPELDGLCLLVERQDAIGGRWESRLCRWFAELVTLSGPNGLPRALEEAAGRIGRRRPLLLFPEGAPRPSAVGAYRPGIGLLALELDLPVVPVRVDLRGPGNDSPRHARVQLGGPVEPGAFRSLLDRLTPYEVYREIAEAVRRSIVGLGPQTSDPVAPGPAGTRAPIPVD